MITGIQITKAANDDLLNSFWLLDGEKAKRVASLRKQVCRRRSGCSKQTG